MIDRVIDTVIEMAVVTMIGLVVDVVADVVTRPSVDGSLWLVVGIDVDGVVCDWSSVHATGVHATAEHATPPPSDRRADSLAGR